MRVYEIIRTSFTDSHHKIFRNPDRDIKVCNLFIVFFTLNEIHNIRMVDTKNPHISTASSSTLLYRLRSSIKNLHKGNRARGHSARGANHAIFRPQTRKAKTSSSTRLMSVSYTHLRAHETRH